MEEYLFEGFSGDLGIDWKATVMVITHLLLPSGRLNSFGMWDRGGKAKLQGAPWKDAIYVFRILAAPEGGRV